MAQRRAVDDDEPAEGLDLDLEWDFALDLYWELLELPELPTVGLAGRVGGGKTAFNGVLAVVSDCGCLIGLTRSPPRW